jgi:hypothetical protein
MEGDREAELQAMEEKCLVHERSASSEELSLR